MNEHHDAPGSDVVINDDITLKMVDLVFGHSIWLTVHDKSVFLTASGHYNIGPMQIAELHEWLGNALKRINNISEA